MVCKANPERTGQGAVISRDAPDIEDAAKQVAEEIENLQSTAGSTGGSGKWSDYGVAVRSNAEAYNYGLEMLKKNIPFRSNARFFNDKTAKAVIGWLTISEQGLSGNESDLQEAIINATGAPFSKLGRGFLDELTKKATGPWPKWLINNYTQIYGLGSYRDYLAHFVANIEAIASLSGSPSRVLSEILELKGIDGKSLRESLIDTILENDEVMQQLSAEVGGRVDPEMIEEQAMSPIKPLLSLFAGNSDIISAMTYVRRLQAVNQKVATADTDAEIDRDAVTIGTMHSWKGLEVPTMYVPMVGGKFPRAGESGEASEGPGLWSERRLAYVAITRAMERCVILDIPNPVTGNHSQFITEACVQEEEEGPKEKGSLKVASKWDSKTVADMRAAMKKIDWN